jgi:alpha-galactosidase
MVPGNNGWNYQDIQVTLNRSITVTAGESAVYGVYFYWHTGGNLPAGLRVLGDHWERGYGDLEFRGIVPDRVMPWYVLASGGGTVMGIGVKTGPSAFCSWQLSRDILSLRVDIRNGGGGVSLAGRALHAAEVVWAEESGISVYDFAKKFCALLCAVPVLPSGPVYGGNDWYYAYGDSSEEKILDFGSLIASLSPGGGEKPFLCIDSGWQRSRDNGDNDGCFGGPWHESSRHFPDMPGLAQKLSREGLRPGLWIRPLQYRAAEYASLMLESPEGKKPGWILDPSRPEVLEIVKADIARIASWGYELIKHDFTTFDIFGRWGKQMGAELTDPSWHFADRSRTSMEIILDLYRTIAAAAGKALVIGCNTVSHGAAGIFALQRTGDDTSGREWERTRKMGVNTMAFRLCQHNTFYAADADCVGVTPRVPWNLNRQWLSLIAESGTPLFVSASQKDITDEQRRDIKAAFAVAAKPVLPPEPLDWLNSTCPSEFLLNGQKRRFSWDDVS